MRRRLHPRFHPARIAEEVAAMPASFTPEEEARAEIYRSGASVVMGAYDQRPPSWRQMEANEDD